MGGWTSLWVDTQGCFFAWRRGPARNRSSRATARQANTSACRRQNPIHRRRACCRYRHRLLSGIRMRNLMDAKDRHVHYSSVNPELLAADPVSAGHVLELGCGTGAFGATWKRRNPRGLWSGIEFVADAVQLAQGVLDDVLCADIETIDDAALDAFLEGRAAPGVLVFGDVLEHLRDPLAVLRRLVDQLAPVERWRPAFRTSAIGRVSPR